MPELLRKRDLKKAVGRGAALTRDEAKRIAPVFTGEVAKGHPPAGTLRKSIIIKHLARESGSAEQVFIVTVKTGKKLETAKRKKRGGKKGETVTLNLNAYYWFMVEFGTSKMSARSFMRPAFERTKSQAVDKIADTIRESLQESSGGALQ